MSVITHAALEKLLDNDKAAVTEPPQAYFLQAGPPLSHQEIEQFLQSSQQNIQQVGIPYKYMEKEQLEELSHYIDSTYGQHYVDPKTNVQLMDMFMSIGISEDFCRGAALKYLCRYGKKDGYNRKDILKALHYIILLMYFTRNKQGKVESTN